MPQCSPDIDSFVPESSFIDVRDYKDWDELLEKLEMVGESEGNNMIQSGRQFLQTAEGKRHSFDGFASFAECLIVNCSLVENGQEL